MSDAAKAKAERDAEQLAKARAMVAAAVLDLAKRRGAGAVRLSDLAAHFNRDALTISRVFGSSRCAMFEAAAALAKAQGDPALALDLSIEADRPLPFADLMAICNSDIQHNRRAS